MIWSLCVCIQEVILQINVLKSHFTNYVFLSKLYFQKTDVTYLGALPTLFPSNRFHQHIHKSIFLDSIPTKINWVPKISFTK